MRKIPTPAPTPTPVTEKKLTPQAAVSKALAAKALAAKTPAAKTVAKAPTSKTPPKPAPPVPKVVAETPATYFAGAAGRAWRMSGKHAVAYVHTAALAGELLATEPRQVAGSAMAVYYDRKGRPFAWQFRFDTTRWAEVTGRLL